MSRKDPRRRIVVTLSSAQRELLRQAVLRSGRKGSLADRLRRIVTFELINGLEDLGASAATGSGLPLQLPHKLRVQIEHLAHDWRQTSSYVVQQALAQHVARSALEG
ncbi:hypothetical protein KMP13_04085 [Epibacterium ulvae]|uniref:hypothetical protein n=1 Tax=Epibacterium ulvae TaxID=1156985 RepID=UPI001BFC4818|nr:hypothetical protein [Epibacterium ulvae]MBT8153079.1 hypothetical protein [Epibacterium ulvae]